MRKTIKLFFRKCKELWNVYGGIAISTLIAWFTHWDKNEMDKWASFLILSLTCISVLTFFGIVLFKKKKKSRIDRGIVNAQKSVKTMRTAIDPMSVGQEVGNAIIYTFRGGRKVMKKIKNFFKELWGNKFTLSNTIIVLFLATLSQVMTYTEYLYKITWFAEHELVIKIASPIIAVVWVFVDLLTTYTKYGFESLEQIAERKANKKISTLSKDEKARLKAQLKDLKSNLNLIKSKHSNLLKTIAEFETLIGAGYALNTLERTQYDESRNQVVNIENTIKNLEQRIEEVEKQL